MARTAYNDPEAESMYQYGAGNTQRMPDAIAVQPYSPKGAATAGHDQKITKKTGYKGR